MNTEITHDQNKILDTGVRLRNAREKLGLSRQDVAERLCLKVSTIRDIEEDNNPVDLASTFLRGYIRSYAKLVHLPEDELLPAIENKSPVLSDRVSQIQCLTLDKRCKKRNICLMAFTWLLLFVVISMIGTWWWQNHKFQKEEFTDITNQSSTKLKDIADINSHSTLINRNNLSPIDELQTTVKDSCQDFKSHQSFTSVNTGSFQIVNKNHDVISLSKKNTNSKIINDNNNLNMQSMQTNQTNIMASPESNILVIKFTNDCWLEVTDAFGKKLFFGMQHTGNTLHLTGQTPYKLKIGAPAAVQIYFQGRSIDLSSFTIRNQVAHLTVNA